MAKKTSSGTATPATSTPAAATTTPAAPAAPKKVANPQRWDEIALSVVNYYQKNTPQRTKLIDVFMAFLVVVGGLQFLYCILAGNYVRFCCGSLPISRSIVPRHSRRHGVELLQCPVACLSGPKRPMCGVVTSTTTTDPGSM